MMTSIAVKRHSPTRRLFVYGIFHRFRHNGPTRGGSPRREAASGRIRVETGTISSTITGGKGVGRA